MCANCADAETCRDLMHILRLFNLEEKPLADDFLRHFPFLAAQSGKKDARNKKNEFTSAEWLRFTKTVMRERFPQFPGHEIRRTHPEYKSPNLLGLLIAFFTKPGETVIDPFAGTGSALIAAAMLDRPAIGIEIKQQWVDGYKKICESTGIPLRNMTGGDSLTLTRHIAPATASFAIVDPPDPVSLDEWYSPDMGAEPSFELYFEMLTSLFANLRRVVAPGGYAALFARNVYTEGEYLYLNSDYIRTATLQGFVLKGEKIWDNPSVKTKPFGYPHAYVPNITHYTIFFFQNPGGGKK